MKRFIVSLVVAVACYTMQDLQRAESRGACKVYCIKVAKLDDGRMLKGRCACVRFHDISKMFEPTLSPMYSDDSENTGEFKNLPNYGPVSTEEAWHFSP